MEKPTLEYDGNLGKEQVRLLVKAYFHEKRLYRTDKGRGWRTRAV